MVPSFILWQGWRRFAGLSPHEKAINVPKVSYRGESVDGIEVRFKVVREDWNEYQLEDGTEIRMRLVISEVVMVVAQYDAEGNPVYAVKSQNLLVVKAPDHLKKPKQ